MWAPWSAACRAQLRTLVGIALEVTHDGVDLGEGESQLGHSRA